MDLILQHILIGPWWLNGMYFLTVATAIVLLATSFDSFRRNLQRELLRRKSPGLSLTKPFWYRGMRYSVERMLIAVVKFGVVGVLLTYPQPMDTIQLMRRVSIVTLIMMVSILCLVNCTLDEMDDTTFELLDGTDDFDLTIHAAWTRVRRELR